MRGAGRIHGRISGDVFTLRKHAECRRDMTHLATRAALDAIVLHNAYCVGESRGKFSKCVRWDAAEG